MMASKGGYLNNFIYFRKGLARSFRVYKDCKGMNMNSEVKS